MNTMHQSESYYDSARSPRGPSHQSQTLNRQSSRNFDAFGQPLDGSYGIDGLNPRYDGPRYDRMNTMPNGYATFEMGMPQAWNNTGFAHNNGLAGINASTRGKPHAMASRPGIPSMWLDQAPPPMPSSNGFSPFGNPSLTLPPFRSDQLTSENEEDLIPTAIVIKNIPFAVKKEQLVQVMTELNLPLPYAFNYHFDNGVFRGLAFANFTTADETATVIGAMNHLELHGRKLRVEYKKMLPQAERDRIEREKRERRGQLEEQHRPMATAQLQTRPSVSSLASAIRGVSPSANAARNVPPTGLDMNDPVTLEFYSKLVVLQSDPANESIDFPPHIPPHHRTIIHGLAHYLGMGHESIGTGADRHVCVYKLPPGNAATLSPSTQQSGFDNRRGLYRAATTDFSDVREQNQHHYGPVGRQASGFLGFPEPQSALNGSNNLRAAKSFADLRSFTPSPQSNNGFPASLAANAARYAAELNQSSPGSNLPQVMTPATTSTSTSGPEALVNGMNSMNINSGFSSVRQTSPVRLRAVMSWERDAPGPIGGHRGFGTTTVEEPTKVRGQNASQARSNRGSIIDRGAGFSRGRSNGHGSHGGDDSLLHNGIDTVVE